MSESNSGLSGVSGISEVSDNGSEQSSYSNSSLCEEEKIIHTICETEECADPVIVDLQDLCRIEGDHVFDRLKKFVDENNHDTLKREMQKLYGNLPKSTSSKINTNTQDYEKFENLLILKMFKRLKLLEKECVEYKTEYEEYDTYNNMYINSSDNSNKVHSFNITAKEDRSDELGDIDQFMKSIMTPHKKQQELLMYELMFYKPKTKIPFIKNNLIDVATKISSDISRFSPIVNVTLEDHSWTVNTEDTLNFSVPQNRVVLSNTINSDDETDSTLATHLNMLIDYIKRLYKVTSAKYTIVPDNKFDVSWVLITIGFASS